MRPDGAGASCVVDLAGGRSAMTGVLGFIGYELSRSRVGPQRAADADRAAASRQNHNPWARWSVTEHLLRITCSSPTSKPSFCRSRRDHAADHRAGQERVRGSADLLPSARPTRHAPARAASSGRRTRDTSRQCVRARRNEGLGAGGLASSSRRGVSRARCVLCLRRAVPFVGLRARAAGPPARFALVAASPPPCGVRRVRDFGSGIASASTTPNIAS